eukprot:14767841-Alexandrium_andersonii.AAC.1
MRVFKQCDAMHTCAPPQGTTFGSSTSVQDAKWLSLNSRGVAPVCGNSDYTHVHDMKRTE